MTSNRKRAASPPQPPGRLTRLQDTQAAPRTGKTTALGKRAEKPSDGSERKGNPPAPEPSRRKAPSPQAHEGVGDQGAQTRASQPPRAHPA